MLRVGTLEDIYVASQNIQKPMVLNCLNLPMPQGGIFHPPRFRYDSVSALCISLTPPFDPPVTWHQINMVGHRHQGLLAFGLHNRPAVNLGGQLWEQLVPPPGSTLTLKDWQHPRSS
jgi:hypothetical protein